MSWVSRNELHEAYNECIYRKINTVNAINFTLEVETYLEELYQELNNMTYTIGQSIVFTLSRYNYSKQNYESYREVFAADFKDRIVHHLLIRRILPTVEKYDLIDDNYSCRKDKGVLYGVKRCQNKLKTAFHNGEITEGYILKADLHNCFNTLNKEKMYDVFEKFIMQYMSNDRNLIFNLYLLKLILFHCPQHNGNYIRKQPISYWDTMKEEKSMFHCDDIHGIAVGNLTSQIFANFYLSLLDHYIVDVLGYTHYGRYVDDFYILGYNKQQMLLDFKKIKQFVKDLDMDVNEKKFYFQHYKHGVQFIGYMVYINKVYIRNTTKYKFYNKMYVYNKNMYKEYGQYNLICSYMYIKTFMQTWNSYCGVIAHTNSQQVIVNVLKRNTWIRTMIKYTCVMNLDNFTIHFNKEMKQLYKNYLLYDNKIRKIKKPIKMQFCGMPRTKEADEIISFM